MKTTPRLSPTDLDLIHEIADRAVGLAASLGYKWRKEDAVLDLLTVHLGRYPLDLVGLSRAGNGDFGHDVFGINKYLDHETHELRECFVPRYARLNDAEEVCPTCHGQGCGDCLNEDEHDR